MSTIHNYYITSQLFQLVEEQIASIEVDKKLKPLAELFVRLFDDLDYNFSNEMVPEALDRLIIFVEKDKVISTVEFADVESFFTDENDHLFVRVAGEILQVVEPGEGEDEEDDLEELEGQEFEEKDEISLDDEDSYIVIDGDEIVEEFELNEEITLEDDNSYIVIDETAAAEFDSTLDFIPNPIILDNAHAELITLAMTTDLDELIAEQIDALPALKEVIGQMKIVRKELKAEQKNSKKKKKSKKEKKKSKKSKKNKFDKKDLNVKIAKKLHKYVLEKELEDVLVLEFLQLKKQIDYILIQY